MAKGGVYQIFGSESGGDMRTETEGLTRRRTTGEVVGVNIVVVEDQVMMRGLIVRVCRDHFPGALVSEAADVRTGRRLCREQAVDLLLLDLDLPDGDGLDFLAEAGGGSPRTRIIVITSHSDDYAIHRCLEAGVAAFVDKCSQPIEVVGEALAAVAAGRNYYSPVVQGVRTRMRMDPKAFNKLLSAREQEILRLLGEGFTNDEVAEKAGVSPQTIHSYRRNIMVKLGIHSTPQLIRYAVEKGFTRLRSHSSTP